MASRRQQKHLANLYLFSLSLVYTVQYGRLITKQYRYTVCILGRRNPSVTRLKKGWKNKHRVTKNIMVRVTLHGSGKLRRRAVQVANPELFPFEQHFRWADYPPPPLNNLSCNPSNLFVLGNLKGHSKNSSSAWFVR